MPDKNQRFTLKLTYGVGAVSLLLITLISAFFIWATSRADQLALERDKAVLRMELEEQLQNTSREQKNVTMWDEAVRRIKANDRVWLKSYTNKWLSEETRPSDVFILDGEDTPVYALHDGETLSSAQTRSAYDLDRATLAPLAQDLRAQMAAAPNAAVAANAFLQKITTVHGRPSVITIRPVTPEPPQLPLPLEDTYLHVIIMHIDQAFIDRIAAPHMVKDARFAPADAPPSSSRWTASIELTSADGAPLGWIQWRRHRPGLALAREVGPALIMGLLLIMSILAYLLFRLRRSSERLEQSRAKAQHLALHDPLTNLPNRTLFEDRLRQALAMTHRRHERIALHYIDIDHFKDVNDTLGHPAGDEIIRQITTRFNNVIRAEDTLARLGGDEFALIQTKITSEHEARRLAERLQKAMEAPFELSGDTTTTGVSIGVALSQDAATPLSELTRKADVALYEAKRRGRGQYQLFAGDMDEKLQRRRVIEQSLYAALRAETGLRQLYQPVFLMPQPQDGDERPSAPELIGAEALPCWEHPAHGALTPDQILRVAADRGMSGLLGKWMLRRALRTLAATSLGWISLPISLFQLRDADYVRNVLEQVAAANIAPSRLQFNMRQRMHGDGHSHVMENVNRLRAAGASFALIDLGGDGDEDSPSTGYSTLSHLQDSANESFRFDKLKMADRLVKKLGQNARADAIADAVASLARAHDASLAATGVSNETQRKRLMQLGCREYQGPLFSEPLEEPALTRLLQTTRMT